MNKKLVRYFDLGLYDGFELKKTKNILEKLNLKYEIYGFEACEIFFSKLTYLNSKNITIFNKAISKKHNETIKLYFEVNGPSEGNSIYKSKYNVSENNFCLVKTILFSQFLIENSINLDDSYNILRFNIEGAEYDLINDLIKNNLNNKIHLYCGSGNDVDKIKYFVDNKLNIEYYNLLNQYKIKIYPFCRYDMKCKKCKRCKKKLKCKNKFNLELKIKKDLNV